MSHHKNEVKTVREILRNLQYSHTRIHQDAPVNEMDGYLNEAESAINQYVVSVLEDIGIIPCEFKQDSENNKKCHWCGEFYFEPQHKLAAAISKYKTKAQEETKE